MRETATTDSIIADMRRLIERIEQALNGKQPDAADLNQFFTAIDDLGRCIYAHETGKRLGELMRQADNFGQAASSVTGDHR
jgi:hypothetical protein